MLKRKAMNYESTVIPNEEDMVFLNSVFSNIEKTILSKDFKGGHITNVFGNTELDFTNADITGHAVLDLSLAFGAISITVPCDWRVETDLSQVLASVDDYRNDIYKTRNSDKLLMIKGSSVCSNVEIQHNC